MHVWIATTVCEGLLMVVKQDLVLEFVRLHLQSVSVEANSSSQI